MFEAAKVEGSPYTVQVDGEDLDTVQEQQFRPTEEDTLPGRTA